MYYNSISILPKKIGDKIIVVRLCAVSQWWWRRHADEHYCGDGYHYEPVARLRADGDDDGDYDYAPAASEGDGDNDDGDYDYAPAA
ncbi:unnamed protein product [Lactuca virosa]|uniref:Uncharacterized protein n=1 Tax=Lactuca virosa TaxID=75947 RepID=A0AAU9LY61_9ASTR|nr:unnamed protein product [Lactuca virosa]